jgi:hypothetical protein
VGCASSSRPKERRMHDDIRGVVEVRGTRHKREGVYPAKR